MSERTVDGAQQDPKRSDEIIDDPAVEIVEESLEEPTTAEGEGDAPAADALRLQAAESLAEERHHQFLRLSADFDNFRRRVERERDELRASVARELLTSLLPAYDNLERALKAVTGDVDPGLVKGLEMTRQSFLDGLAGQGVERVLTTGQPFDPTIHEAIQSTPDASAEGTVLDEYQAGFRWRDRVLRAALVKVSSGPAADDN
ncbi:MAG: nucleotide exchange factor GrpE [Thermaerobacter sp.]|nr:nucleotide exchange factor GrpE [Thermaerobacter sp.]